MQAIVALVAMLVPVIPSILVLLRIGTSRQLATLDLDTAHAFVMTQKLLLDERRPPTVALPDLVVSHAACGVTHSLVL